MKVDSYLRMVLMFGENRAQTLYKNLEKMIALVLYDFEQEERQKEKKKQKGLTVVDIIDQLKKRYSLNFSDAEVFAALQNRGQSRIVCVHDDCDRALMRFAITPEEFGRISQRDNETEINTFIREFLIENDDIDFQDAKMVELLHKHFYTVFNSNAATILDLINRNYDYTADLNTQYIEFSLEEKEAINRFLYWENAEKNKFVYEMVSCCFDYCMMTIKQNSSVFKDIFNQKIFYLDANIVFRLMGLNHENRRKVINTFINKCKEQRVKIRITNHTRQEVTETIEHHVKTIINLLHGQRPLHPRAVWSMSAWIVNESFYQAY